MEQNFSLQFLLQYSSFIITLLISLFSIIYFKMSSSSRNTISLPPSPPKLPIIGNLHQIGFHLHHSLRSLSQQYGSLMLLHFGSVPVLVVSSPDAAREILKTHDITFANRPKSVIIAKLLYDYKAVASAPHGEYWRQMRSICVSHLLSNQRVQAFRYIREEEVKIMIENIKSLLAPSVINLSEILASYTNDVVCRVVLGKKYSEGKGFKKLIEEFSELLGVVSIGNFIPWLAWVSRLNGLDARIERVAKELDGFFESVIEEHIIINNQGRKKEQLQDFVDILLWIQKENIIGFPLDRISIKALIQDMFAAGTDTTYNAAEWAMTELLRNPKAMRNVQEEVRTIAGDKSYITQEDLTKLPYLKAVIKESLRLHPPFPLLPRESTQDVMINGYHIAAKTQVLVNAFAIGRDPLSWEQPEEFLPERFLDLNNTCVDVKGHDFELIPFGSGRRGCPGIYFAMATKEIALANLLCNFDWALTGKENAEDLDMKETIGLTIHRKFPLIVIATAFL